MGIKNLFSRVCGDKCGDKVEDVIDNINDVVEDVVDDIGDIVEDVADDIGDILEPISKSILTTLEYACKNNLTDILAIVAENHKNIDLDHGFLIALQEDAKDVVDYILNQNYKLDLQEALKNASQIGKEEVVKKIMEKIKEKNPDNGISQLNEGLISASQTDQINIIDTLINNGANDLIKSLHIALESGNTDTVNYLFNLGAERWIATMDFKYDLVDKTVINEPF